MLCETEEGCPIGDIAPSVRANRMIHGYLDYRLSSTARKLPEIRRYLLKKAGLLKHPDLICTLDVVFDTWRNQARKKNQQDQEFASRVKREASFRKR